MLYKKILLNIFIASLLTSCSSTLDVVRHAESAYYIYNTSTNEHTASTTNTNKSDNNIVEITGLNPGDPKTPKGWSALVVSIDGVKLDIAKHKSLLTSGEHTLELECYSPGSDMKTSKVTKIFESSKKYIITTTHNINKCNIVTLS